MKSLPWFRAYTEMVDDEKLRLLAFEDRWHFVALLCLKGQGLIDEGGPLLFRKVAVKLGIDARTLDEVARRIAEVGLIDEVTLQPIAWNSRQMRSDKDMTNAERQARYRDSLKDKKPVSNALRNVTVTRIDIDTDTDIDKEVKTKEARAPRFDAQAHLVSIGVDQQVSSDWLQHRKAKKASVTKTVIEGIIKEADKAQITIGDALAMCCQRGWIGFKAEWVAAANVVQMPRMTQHQLNQAGVANSIFGYLDQPARSERMIAGEVVA